MSGNGLSPMHRIVKAVHETMATMQERGARGLTYRDEEFWSPGFVMDCGHTTLVRQGNRTLPDGRVVPGPWLAYRKSPDGQPTHGGRPAPVNHAAERQAAEAERALAAEVRAVSRSIGADSGSAPSPGALVQLVTDRQTTDVARVVKSMLSRFGSDFAPLQVVFAGQAPTAWGEAWDLPSQPATVLVAEVWPSLAAPQVSAVVDAISKRRRSQTVVVLTGTGWDRAGVREREQFGRLEELVKRSGRVGRV